MNSILSRLAAGLLLGSSALHANNLVAPFDGGNGNEGIMFDVVGIKDVQLNGVSLSIDQTGFVPIEVYARDGTWQGSEGSSAGWQLIFSGSVFVTTASSAPSSPVEFTTPVQIEAGSRAALYITVPQFGATANLVYSNGSSSPPNYVPVVSNDDLEILEGAGLRYAFGTLSAPRKFNGVLSYSFFTPEPPPVATPSRPTIRVQGGTRLNVTTGTRRLRGTATAAASVRVRLRQAASGGAARTTTRSVNVSASGTWTTNLRLRPGRNTATVTAIGSGGSSTPVTVRITRR